MSTNKKLMTGRMVRLDIAVTLYFLEPDTLYGVTEVTRTRFETNESMRQRLSRQVLRKNLKPEATGECPGGQLFGKFSGETFRGMYRDWEENEQRAMLALRLLRWIAAQKGKGCVSDPEPVLYKIMRLTAFGLDAVLHDLATNEHPNPDAATIARAIRDLTPEARVVFLDRFGTKPIPGVKRRQEKPKVERVPVLVVPRKWAAIFAAAIVFFFFAASPFRWSVVTSVFQEEGLDEAIKVGVRSGLFYSDEPKALRTSAYLFYRNRDYEKAITTAKQLTLVDGISDKLKGDAYQVIGNASLDMGSLYEARVAFEKALDTYASPYEKSYSLGGIAKTAFYLNEDHIAKKALEELYRTYQKANNTGDLDTYMFFMAKIKPYKDAVLHCQNYIAFYEETKNLRGVANANLALAQVTFFEDPMLSIDCAAKALAISRNTPNCEVIEIYALATLAGHDSTVGFYSVKEHFDIANDYQLKKYLEQIGQPFD